MKGRRCCVLRRALCAEVKTNNPLQNSLSFGEGLGVRSLLATRHNPLPSGRGAGGEVG